MCIRDRIDAARGDCEVEKNFIDCALFLNFFATVTQGPICRAGALLPQFKMCIRDRPSPGGRLAANKAIHKKFTGTAAQSG